ncbi:hypothetical protein LTS18_001641, partial [Coniosporium uncinatum]
MRQQGVPENDPEYIKARNLLQAVQQKTALAKQQQQYRAMMQQQAQQQGQRAQQQFQNGQNGAAPHTVANGTSTAVPTATEGQAAATSQPQTNTQVSAEKDKPMPATVNGTNVTFSKEQLNLLRTQIAAFKQLSKNLPIPPNIRQALFPSQQSNRVPTPAEAVATAHQAVEEAPAAKSGETNAQQDGEAKELVPYKTFSNPYAMLKEDTGSNGYIYYGEHKQRDKRMLIPSIMPIGIDVDKAREERENLVYNRIVARRTEIEKLPANLGVWNTAK